MVPNQWIAGLFLLFGFLAAGWGAKKKKLRYFVKLWARMKQVSADYSNSCIRCSRIAAVLPALPNPNPILIRHILQELASRQRKIGHPGEKTLPVGGLAAGNFGFWLGSAPELP